MESTDEPLAVERARLINGSGVPAGLNLRATGSELSSFGPLQSEVTDFFSGSHEQRVFMARPYGPRDARKWTSAPCVNSIDSNGPIMIS